jgi:hypothetical protein
LSDGPTGNVAAKFAELGRTLRDLPSAFACRASTESGSMIYIAAGSRAFQTYQYRHWRIPDMSVSSIRSSDEERTKALYGGQHKGYQNNAFNLTDLFVHQCVAFHIDTLCSLSHTTPSQSTKVTPQPYLETIFLIIDSLLQESALAVLPLNSQRNREPSQQLHKKTKNYPSRTCIFTRSTPAATTRRLAPPPPPTPLPRVPVSTCP